MKECPFCKERIDSSAVKCKYCKSIVDTEVSSNSELERNVRPAQKITVVKSTRKKWLLWVPVLLVTIASLILLGDSLATPGDDVVGDDTEAELTTNDPEDRVLQEEKEETEPEQSRNSEEEAAFEEDPVTVESINRKYEPKFERLEEEITAELIKMFNAAMQEYDQANGGVLFQIGLVNKYMRKVQNLEDRADERFYRILDQMEEELLDNDLPTTIISELEEDYLRDKQEKKRELTNFLQNPNLD